MSCADNYSANSLKSDSPVSAYIEHVTAVTASVKDKLTLSLGVAAGSSIVSTSFFL